MVIVDSVTRLLDDVLGNKESLESESHNESGTKDFPVYTRPEEFESWQVPQVLLSGNHEQIKQWRQQKKK